LGNVISLFGRAGNDRYFGDELERFQFSIGQAF